MKLNKLRIIHKQYKNRMIPIVRRKVQPFTTKMMLNLGCLKCQVPLILIKLIRLQGRLIERMGMIHIQSIRTKR
jgi:hypothetical protein